MERVGGEREKGGGEREEGGNRESEGGSEREREGGGGERDRVGGERVREYYISHTKRYTAVADLPWLCDNHRGCGVVSMPTYLRLHCILLSNVQNRSTLSHNINWHITVIRQTDMHWRATCIGLCLSSIMQLILTKSDGKH